MASNKRKKPANPKPKTPGAGRRTAIPSNEPAHSASFPIVGIGASAGGLEAFTKLLQKLPADTGMALVLIQHLDPNNESILRARLSRGTGMPVQEVANKMRVLPNPLYVIPRNTTMGILDSRWVLTGRLNRGKPQMRIDIFFQSRAQAKKK